MHSSYTRNGPATSPKVYRWVRNEYIRVKHVGNQIVGSKASLTEQLTGRPCQDPAADDLLWGGAAIASFINKLSGFEDGTDTPK